MKVHVLSTSVEKINESSWTWFTATQICKLQTFPFSQICNKFKKIYCWVLEVVKLTSIKEETWLKVTFNLKRELQNKQKFYSKALQVNVYFDVFSIAIWKMQK